MNRLNYLWHVTTKLSTNPAVLAAGLHTFYVERCREIESEHHLPRRMFGDGEMCSYCGFIWDKFEPRVRLVAGKRPAKSVLRIMNKGGKLHRFKETLVKKSVKNSLNKMVIKCPVCSKDTKVNLTKPRRLKKKCLKIKTKVSNELEIVKKRKKRTKDKTAGLILTPNQNNSKQSIPTPKEKSTNLKKLGAIIGKNLTPSKKSSIHEFITELTS